MNIIYIFVKNHLIHSWHWHTTYKMNASNVWIAVFFASSMSNANHVLHTNVIITSMIDEVMPICVSKSCFWVEFTFTVLAIQTVLPMLFFLGRSDDFHRRFYCWDFHSFFLSWGDNEVIPTLPLRFCFWSNIDSALYFFLNNQAIAIWIVCWLRLVYWWRLVYGWRLDKIRARPRDVRIPARW